MTKSLFTVTRFSFIGGRAKPVEQTLSLEGLNKYGTKHITFSANVEGKEKPAHLFNLAIEDAQGLVNLMKTAIAEAKAAPDTTPAEYIARMAKKASVVPTITPQTLTPTAPPMDLQAMLAMLQAAGLVPQTAESPSKPLEPKKVTKRTPVNEKPAQALKPESIPTVDDLEEITTPAMESALSILSMLLGKRGNK